MSKSESYSIDKVSVTNVKHIQMRQVCRAEHVRRHRGANANSGFPRGKTADQESQSKRVPRLTKSDCPSCRNQHRAHTRVGFCRLAPKEDGQRQNDQHKREQSDTNRPAPVEASHRKRQAHPKSSPKKQQLTQAKKSMSWFFSMRFLLFTILSVACIFAYG